MNDRHSRRTLALGVLLGAAVVCTPGCKKDNKKDKKEDALSVRFTILEHENRKLREDIKSLQASVAVLQNQVSGSDRHATKPAASRPAPSSRPDGSCLDEVGCLLADKPPECCHKYLSKLSREQISRTVRTYLSQIKECGDQHKAKGTVKVSVDVTPAGEVSKTVIIESPDAALGQCVERVLATATFPKAGGGSHFTYPFVFNP